MNPTLVRNSIHGRDVHIWRVPLQAADNTIAEFESILLSEELARAARFRSDHLQRRFIVGRGTLRILLASYLHAHPARLQFSYGPQGKPYVNSTTGIHFNVSHSDDLALLAFTMGCDVGIDIERIRSQPDLLGIARRFFNREEVAELELLPAGECQYSFYLCWTRKEAYIKASGDGLSAPLHSFRVTLRSGEPACLTRLTQISDDSAWTIHDLSVMPNYAAALVYNDSPRPVCFTTVADPSNLLESKLV
jgi:4'-phosphopantetheinyl transferase